MKVMIIALFVFAPVLGFSQNDTKEGLKQIALLQLYIGYLQKGYSIAKKGLNTISDITNGHWDLDKVFFNSLKDVNPKVREYAKVAAIVSYQVKIVKIWRGLPEKGREDEEAGYLKSVGDKVIAECSGFISLLETVLKSGSLQMSDDERMGMIDKLYNDVTELYSFTRKFSNEADALLLQRRLEENDVKVSKEMKGL